MKNIRIFVIFIISSFLIIKSLGNDISFIKDGKEWHCTTEYSYDSNMEPNYSYKLIGDTILNNTTYKKVFHQQENLYQDNDWHYYAAVSEVDKKVYIVPQNEESATLLYDFGIEEGEVVNSFELHSKTDYWVRGYTRNYINVVAHANEGVDVPTRLWTWVEGIGCQEDPFNSENWHNGGSSILSCYENNTLIFGHQDFTNPQPQPEHEYIPFVEEGNAWVFENSVQMGAFQYSIGETETIDGVEYRVIYETFYNAMTGVSNDPRKYSYIREENGIVYMGIGANTQPIYDFSLQKDDTAYWGQYVIAGIDIIDKYVYVKDVSYSQIAGKERKVLNVEICAKSLNGNNDDKKHTETWIEGIGATTDVFTAERMRWDYELTGPSNSWAYYYNYSTQTSYPDDARLYSFATQPEHEYIPLLSPSSEWVELAYKAYVRYAISDTTTMNSKEYCVISGTEMWLPEKEIHSSNSKLYVREEGKRVYLYDEYAPDKEELLFDFGAKAGDRIVVSDDANNSRVIAINSVETITLDGKERNLLHVSYIYNESIDTNDTWIEGIGPTQSFLFNNIIRWGGSGYSYFHYFYDNNTEFIYPEESEVIDFDPQPQHEYLPTCVAGREYFYVNNSDTLKINTQPSQKKEGYIIFDCNNNDSPPYSTILKDFNSQIHRNYDDMSFSDGVLVKFKENFKTFDNDVVYFDYDLQVGDTLSVIYFMNTGLGYYESHKIYGKIINVLSIDTTMLQSRKHLRYMLRSIDFEASLWTDFDERPDGPPINYRYNYKIVKIGEPYNDAWIEGIGYTRYSGIYTMSNNKAGTLQCVFEKGELIYCAEGANCDGLSDNANEKIDITTLTLHREGDVLVAVFPVVGAGEAITLYDATGRVVASQPLRQGATTATIDISHLPQGIYIAHMDNGASCKVVL